MAIFGPKPWANPFGKMSIIRLFELLVFRALKGVFFVLEYHKKHFPGLYCLKKKIRKMAIFGPKPWKNVNFSTLRTSCFYSLERRFSVLEYHKRLFPGPCCLKKKGGKMAIFGPKSWVNPFWKMSILRLFEVLVFIA